MRDRHTVEASTPWVSPIVVYNPPVGRKRSAYLVENKKVMIIHLLKFGWIIIIWFEFQGVSIGAASSGL